MFFRLDGVRERCLVALQAILEVVEVDQIGGMERLFSCWSGVRKLALLVSTEGEKLKVFSNILMKSNILHVNEIKRYANARD